MPSEDNMGRTMIVQKEFFNRLKDDFRLNIYEVKIWTSLLTRGVASAGELADISGVPRSRCYDVLESLEKKGFIVMKIGRPIKYIAVPPEDIMERVKRSLRAEQEINIRLLDEIKNTDVYKELDLLHKTGIERIDSSDITDMLMGRSAIQSALKSMLEKAKSSVMIAADRSSIDYKAKLLRKVQGKLKRSGVTVKVIAPIDLNEAKRLGIDHNSLESKNPKSRCVIVDGSEAVFLLSEDSEDELEPALWVRSPFFVSSFELLFSDFLKQA